MNSVLSSNFVKETMDSFIDSFAVDNFYLFVSDTFDGTDIKNSDFFRKDTLKQTVFGKKILPDNVFYGIKENIWSSNTVYQSYDDSIDLSATVFYITVDSDTSSTGDYEVYKCISNNNGAKSTVAPVYNEDIEDQLYRTNDGYIWKYMYRITEQEYDKYNSNGYIPIIVPEPSANTIPTTNSSVSSIVLENLTENRGYSNTTGDIDQVFTVNIEISGSTLNRYDGFYNGQTFYVTDTNNLSKLYNIDTYTFNMLTGKGTITLTDKDSFITDTCTYSILPKIKITGDGSGAVAYPRIVDGSIVEIIMISSGNDYTFAAAEVIDPLYNFDPDLASSNYNTALLRVILSPENGHGFDLATELFTDRILVFSELTETDNLTVPTINSFSRVCIVKNPEFTSNTEPSIFDNRLRVTLSASSPTSVGEKVLQRFNGEVTFEGNIHEKSGNTLLLTDYTGPYQVNPMYGDISIYPARQIEIETSQLFNINNIITSSYVQGSGEVIYMTSFNPIDRTPASREQFRIAISF